MRRSSVSRRMAHRLVSATPEKCYVLLVMIEGESNSQEIYKQEMETLVSRLRPAIPWAIAQKKLQLSSPEFYQRNIKRGQSALRDAEAKDESSEVDYWSNYLEQWSRAEEADRQTLSFLEGLTRGEYPDDWFALPNWEAGRTRPGLNSWEAVFRHNVIRIPATLERAKMAENEEAELRDYLQGYKRDISDEEFDSIFSETLAQYRQLEHDSSAEPKPEEELPKDDGTPDTNVPEEPKDDGDKKE